VSDRFGDSGLTGVLGVERDGAHARVTDFLLSCRVMGRKVEETMLHVAIAWSRATSICQLEAIYMPTPRNAPCFSFFEKSGWSIQRENTFVWDTAHAYPLHPAVQLISQPDHTPAGSRLS